MALKGEISDIPIEQVFSLIEGTKGTGKLSLENSMHKVVIHFKNGALVNAEGDKTPVSSLELAFGFADGSFEFDKTDDVFQYAKIEELSKSYKDKDTIKNDWSKIKKVFPSENLTVMLSNASQEEIEITGEEWKIISLLRQPIPVSGLLKTSHLGIFETFKILLSVFNKGLVEIGSETEIEPTAIDDSVGNIVPVRNLGYWAMRSPIEGIKAIEFYRRIDDKKTLKEIAREMDIPLKEAKGIFDYLLKADKLDKPRG